MSKFETSANAQMSQIPNGAFAVAVSDLGFQSLEFVSYFVFRILKGERFFRHQAAM